MARRLYSAMAAAVDSAVSCDPEILGGTPVFTGTRVPVDALIDWLAAGETLDYFLDQFPTVTREQAERLLHDAMDALLDPARVAR